MIQTQKLELTIIQPTPSCNANSMSLSRSMLESELVKLSVAIVSWWICYDSAKADACWSWSSLQHRFYSLLIDLWKLHHYNFSWMSSSVTKVENRSNLELLTTSWSGTKLAIKMLPTSVLFLTAYPWWSDITGLVQDGGNSIANALELPQSCTKPSIGRDQSWYALSQWETSLQCNDISHWLGAYLDWSQDMRCL